MPALVDSDSDIVHLARCIDCGVSLDGRTGCPECGRSYPVNDGILEAMGPLSGNNQIAAAFYNGPTWPRFKFWENVFLWFQGLGVTRARRKVLQYLPRTPHARVLEVGIGDGENLSRLPLGWEVHGVDIARNRLTACLDRAPSMFGRLALAEAERLPFADGTFDAVFTVGGINYFRDPAAALHEMRRVARSGGVLLAADERPDLYRFSLGHALNVPTLDRFFLRKTGLPPEFLAMVYDTPPAVEPAAREVWPTHRRISIWNGLGYCLVDVRHD